MIFKTFGGAARLAVLGGCMIGLVACQSGSGTETGETMSPTDMAQARPKISQNELEAFCPPVSVRQGTASYSAYARGGQDDPTKLTYQASIASTTRACSRADGTLTINVAIAGRIVPGPAGAPGAVTMPIRIAVTRGDEVLYSQMIKDQVTLGAANAATQFLVKDPNITIPIPDRRNVRVQVGFDGANPTVKAGEPKEEG